MVFHWSLSDSKSSQVSRSRLRILAVLSNTLIRIVSTRLPTSKSSRPFNNAFVIVPKAPIKIGTIVTFIFHSIFNSLARSRYLSFFSHSFRFILWSAWTAMSTILQIFFFCWLITYSFRVFHISVSWWFSTGVWVTASLLQVSRSRLRIPAVLSNAVVWIVSTRLPNSKSSRPFNNPLVIVPDAPISGGLSLLLLLLFTP